ncbi:hypothetical protein Poli38472_013256 [Pythium oligandrum]|uniref:Enoyl reductase (ER) domain-containing protein n=1 Tax=Pythium oligandrum TaxID=41045 RepID=A0A8K1F9M1_PYTOL|nr:hypothetical protein Poli38472_013256 [Pythium oligandrum]|eukprot:TMW55365.1 hypothetical protein Poli38472_013256 [Pythium oligandrum]
MTLPSTFRGYVYESFGDYQEVIKFRSDLTHKPLASNQVRVRVHSAALNPGEYKVIEYGARMLPTPPTPEEPFGIGFDFAGTLVEVGQDVNDLTVGDEVYGMVDLDMGSFAEYLVVGAESVAFKPHKVSFDHAAGVPIAGLTSYQAFTKHARFQSGQRVLILAGSSATGLFGIQMAKVLGASFAAVTASARNHELVKSYGADLAIDYTTEKWADVLEPNSIDFIYSCGVEPNAWNENAKRVLKKNTGVFVTIDLADPPLVSPVGATFILMRAVGSKADLTSLAELMDAGKIVTPIDSVHPFENLLEAVKKLKSNRARGKIILQIASA